MPILPDRARIATARGSVLFVAEARPTMTLSGRCACGAVRYSIAAAPLRAFQCQCKDCQRDTGTGHSSVMVFNRSALTIDGGVAEISRDADTGNRKTKGFCGA